MSRPAMTGNAPHEAPQSAAPQSATPQDGAAQGGLSQAVIPRDGRPGLDGGAEARSGGAGAAPPLPAPPLEHIPALDWPRIRQDLDSYGCAVLPALLTTQDCSDLVAAYPGDAPFRSHIHMARHGFGRGEYKYFRYPLPDPVGRLRRQLYPPLAEVANGWSRRMGLGQPYPASHDAFLRQCHAAGQTRPAPLLLQYGPGDYNCLHQDLYGPLAFPIQLACLLSEPGRDFSGGEFVLTEQRPRMQSRVEVVPLRQGDAVVFAVHTRPVEGKRGDYRVTLRHGVSRLRSGQRHCLGIIFHDAR